VKWLLLDFSGRFAAGAAAWRLRSSASTGGGSDTSSGLRLVESSSAVLIETGAATFHLGRAAGLLGRAVVAGKDVLQTDGALLTLTDRKGRRSQGRIEQMTVEARGPVRASVCLTGAFAGAVPARFVARVCFFAGTGLVRIRLTVHNPNRARHPGGLWDLGDAGSMLFRGLALEVGIPGPARVAWRAEPGQPAHRAEDGVLEIYQDSSGGDNWQSRNHVNRDGRIPCSFRGARVRTRGSEERTLRASPVVAVEGQTGCVTAKVAEFWQQFPKALEATARRLSVGLFPEQFADLFELQGGEQKTRTLCRLADVRGWWRFLTGGRTRPGEPGSGP
jgi:hypothetical protein